MAQSETAWVTGAVAFGGSRLPDRSDAVPVMVSAAQSAAIAFEESVGRHAPEAFCTGHALIGDQEVV